MDGSRYSGPLTFVDAPDLVSVLTGNRKFSTFTKAELDGSFDASAWPDVLASDIRSWCPGTLGAALFNYWD
ncbi:hypothetical protein FKR81_30165 [Lentzea tibetensis]|uniref:Uncharacterized protein n=1 Tax=Lentzea tibetensis TaxID=2591470 RepID=A0A563ELK5_9PSEU|nr:hypothetical protein [Lentzea tibetensis]TWP47943.1 hypothetical protein FKR81_30165 [Lentzea tibetensis]